MPVILDAESDDDQTYDHDESGWVGYRQAGFGVDAAFVAFGV